MIQTLSPLDDKLVLMGMSCVGKTSMAHELKTHQYYSFDAQFKYGLKVPGISRKKNWQLILDRCTENKFVLDNWSTEDVLGKTIYHKYPDACICVVFDRYQDILRRYRVPVTGKDAHYKMYEKMYCEIPFEDYQRVRYFRWDQGNYVEYLEKEFGFREFIQQNLTRDPGGVFNPETWEWDFD